MISHQKPIVTFCMPCYGRPARTERAINCIINQTITNWEAFIVGDGCPEFEKLIPKFDQIIKDEAKKGNRLILYNRQPHAGYFGYAVRNEIVQKATGVYFLYLDNDDQISPDHAESRVSAMIASDNADFLYFKTYLPGNVMRGPELKEGYIGHSELIVRTDFLQKMPPQVAQHGHDWYLIRNMMEAGGRSAYVDKTPTYYVMGVGANREPGID